MPHISKCTWYNNHQFTGYTAATLIEGRRCLKVDTHCSYQAWLLTLILMNCRPLWLWETDCNLETDPKWYVIVHGQLKSILDV